MCNETRKCGRGGRVAGAGNGKSDYTLYKSKDKLSRLARLPRPETGKLGKSCDLCPHSRLVLTIWNLGLIRTSRFPAAALPGSLSQTRTPLFFCGVLERSETCWPLLPRCEDMLPTPPRARPWKVLPPFSGEVLPVLAAAGLL